MRSRFRVQDLEFAWLLSSGILVWGVEFKVEGARIQASGLRCRVGEEGVVGSGPVWRSVRESAGTRHGRCANMRSAPSASLGRPARSRREDSLPRPLLITNSSSERPYRIATAISITNSTSERPCQVINAKSRPADERNTIRMAEIPSPLCVHPKEFGPRV